MLERTNISKEPINEADQKIEQMRKNFEWYAEGCRRIGEKLALAVATVHEQDKRPTVLIPSRGAVPIILLSSFKNNIETFGISGINYYPECVFGYLSGGMCQKNGHPEKESEVDVILYPFTADVLAVDAKTMTSEDLAERIRRSATSAFLSLVSKKEEGRMDLEWYFFLMGKLNQRSWPEEISPQKVIKSLKTIGSHGERQIIILDTVISGRAAFNITKAFRDFGHPVIPILAVDANLNKLRGEFKQQILDSTAEACGQIGFNEKDIFSVFPLVSEDQGPDLLGVMALNFSNFNKSGVFNLVNPQRFEFDFIPQSCVWALSPSSIETFRFFIRFCQDPENQNFQDFAELWKKGPSTSPEINKGFINSLINEAKGCKVKRTSSNIYSIQLPVKTCEEWIREFAKHLEGSE